MGAIAQLGGAKGIQQMFVESVTNQQLLQQTRHAVLGEERSTGKELMDLTSKLSENVQSGAFERKDWLETIKGIGVIASKQSSLDEGTLTTLGKFAVVTGSSIQEQGDIFARLQAQHRDLNNDQIIQLMLNAHAVGQRGFFNEAEMAKSPLLFGLANEFKGDAATTTNMLGTVGSSLASSGGVTLNEAGTMLSSIMGAAMKSKNPMWHIDPESGKFNDPAGFLESLVNTRQDVLDTDLAKGGMAREPRFAAVKGSIALRAGISNLAGVADDESYEAQQGRTKFIEDMVKLHFSMQDLQKEFDESLSPQERFRASFNRIANTLEGKFLETLQTLGAPGGVLDTFANNIVSQKDKIGDYFTKFTTWLSVAVQVLPDVVSAAIALGSAAGMTALHLQQLFNFITGGPSIATNKEDAAANVKGAEESLTNTFANPDSTPAEILAMQKLVDRTKANQNLVRILETTPADLKKQYEDTSKANAEEAKKWDEEQKRKSREEGKGIREHKSTSPIGTTPHMDLKAALEATVVPVLHDIKNNTGAAHKAPSTSANGR